MSPNKKKKDWRDELEGLADQLRDPFRMRLAVAGAAAVVLFFAISEPLHGRTKRVKRELNQLEQTIKTSQHVQLLRASLDGIDQRIIQGAGNDPVTDLFISLFRESSVDLLQINAEAAQRLGPIYNVRVTIDLSGEFNELVQALHQIESQETLIRVESMQINPAERGSDRPTLHLALRVLKEKA